MKYENLGFIERMMSCYKDEPMSLNAVCVFIQWYLFMFLVGGGGVIYDVLNQFSDLRSLFH